MHFVANGPEVGYDQVLKDLLGSLSRIMHFLCAFEIVYVICSCLVFWFRLSCMKEGFGADSKEICNVLENPRGRMV